MFKSLKDVASESESAALSISIDDDDTYDASDKPKKIKENKSVNLIRSLSSNIKEKLQKKKFHRLELEDDEPSDSLEDDMDPRNENIELTQTDNINGNDSFNDGDIELSQISNEDDGIDADYDSIHSHQQMHENKFETTYNFCRSLSSICCHLLTMIFVSFTQIMVSYALYIIVPLHVAMTLDGGELLTGLIFLNYGFAYVVFHIFGNICNRYYGSTFTILLAIFIGSLSILFMCVFTDYFVWLMMMFCQGISFSLFRVGSHQFVSDNILIKLHNNFTRLCHAFNYVAMILAFVYCGDIIANNSISMAIGITFGLSLSGLLFLCIFSIPPKYNDDCLVKNDSRILTKASISAWKSSYKQLSFKQRFSLFSWIKNKEKRCKDIDRDNNTPVYELDDKLNTLQVFSKNASTLFSIMIFSFGLTFVRCCRLLIITFKCLQIDELTPNDIGYINGISFVPELFLYIFSSYILHKCGRKYTLFPSYLLFIISLFSLPYCNNKQSLSYISLSFGIANGLSYGLIHKIAIDISPTEYRDKFLMIYETLTNLAYIITPIFITLLIQVSSITMSCFCSGAVVILSLIWSVCFMADPKQNGKSYHQIDFEKSYQIEDEDKIAVNLINGKHIGPPINKHKIKMELHSIDSVMELDNIAGNDTNIEMKENNIDNNNNIYVDRIASKPIGDVKLGQNENELNQYKFEIGHFDEEEEEESIIYQLSSTDED